MIDPERPDYTSTPAAGDRPVFAYALADARREPVITVVTPFYNTGAIFHETARSVVRQSLQQWEWLIINDASTESEALSVLAQYRNSDIRIRVIDLPVNGGPSRARNVGYAQARAPYVLQLDSDNLLEPTAAEKWWWYLDTHPRAAFVKGYSVGFGSQTYLWRRGFHTDADFLESNPVDATSLVRVVAHRRAGGYDETIRGGLEDWDFWMRCAAAGEWGDTVPEFLDWYRRRPNHNDRWDDWDGSSRQKAFIQRLRQKYPSLWTTGLPRIEAMPARPNAALNVEPPDVNVLGKRGSRLLLIVPWMAVGGSDKFNLDVVEQLTSGGWEVTVAALRRDSTWLPHFARVTPDVFVLPDVLPATEYPRFLLYLLRSRQPDVVMLSHAELAYHLLPFLRAHASSTTFVDYCHVVEEAWHDGGYPRLSVQYRDFLDLSIVSSHHLAAWMTTEGADPDRVSVCYTGARMKPERERLAARAKGREELGVDEDALVLLYPARLCAQKQPRVFAYAVRLLADEGLRFTCIVAGDGPERGWLGAYVKRKRLTDRVRLLGAVSPSRMAELMAAADICVLPSTHEGIAVTLYEAMSAGVVFVGADVGGQREIVDESCGVLLPRLHDEQREAAAYAVALSQLMRDRAALRALGDAARHRVGERFSLSDMATGLKAAFSRAQQLHDSRPRAAIHPDIGNLTATRAVEHDRLSHIGEGLWATQHPGGAASGGGWRLWIFRQCSKLEPAYAWGVRRGWQWLPAARERIRSTLAS